MASPSLSASSQAILQQVPKLRQAQREIAQAGKRIINCRADLAISASETYFTELERVAYNLVSTVEVEAFKENRAWLAEKVFGIPELLEHICTSGLSVRDLLNAQQVNKTFLAGISASRKVLRLMGLSADAGASYSSAFECGPRKINEFHTFRTRLREHSRWIHTTSSNEPSVEFTAWFWSETDALPRLGSRPRTMLVCQPPVHEITVKVSCCHRTTTVRSATGVTVGDLYEAAVVLSESHRLCPYAYSEFSHDKKGNVKVRVSFEGDVPISEKDKRLVREKLEPMVPNDDSSDEDDDLPVPRKDSGPKEKLARKRQAKKDMREYIVAKQAAHRGGRTILTLAQYLDDKYNKSKPEPTLSEGQQKVVISTGGGEVGVRRSTRLRAKDAGS